MDPTTSFTTLSGDYSSAISVQGTGSNKASNTEALQALVEGTKGNLYKFTDHAGTVYWFTCANAVTMTGDTVTVTDCDYVVGNGTTVYSGGTLVFKAWQASPADQFTQLNGPYTVNAAWDSGEAVPTETDALNRVLVMGTNHYKVTDAVSKITYYIGTNDTCTDGQQFTTSGAYVASNENTLVHYSQPITLIPYSYPDEGFPPSGFTADGREVYINPPDLTYIGTSYPTFEEAYQRLEDVENTSWNKFYYTNLTAKQSGSRFTTKAAFVTKGDGPNYSSTANGHIAIKNKDGTWTFNASVSISLRDS